MQQSEAFLRILELHPEILQQVTNVMFTIHAHVISSKEMLLM